VNGSGGVTSIRADAAVLPHAGVSPTRGGPKAARPLKRGSVGTSVARLQERLIARGFVQPSELGKGTGVYGPRTERAVAAAQEAYGLPVTGAADRRTLAALSQPAAPAEGLLHSDSFATPGARRSFGDTVTDDDTAPMDRPSFFKESPPDDFVRK
jgi:peptidoglycan hydrolase-like protein with peptidoglycan-binding domain